MNNVSCADSVPISRASVPISLLESDDPLIPNAKAAIYINWATQTLNKHRSEQTKLATENRDPRFWIPYHPLGGRIYYRKSVLDDFVARNKVT